VFEHDVADPEEDAVIESDVACRQIEGQLSLVECGGPTTQSRVERGEIG
jgi:hypothetical protein